jgi:prolyl-tRNA editing enzyme YbaK/EbsC (Cys-tRNA(Pro) deacylase)
MSDLPPLAPGLGLASQPLDREVVSCVEAAAAKRIPLRHELKSLVLDTSRGTVVVHIPGDMQLSLRKVKRQLTVEEAFVAPPERMAALGLIPGTVCAVLDPVWSLPALVSRAVLSLDFVSTNNGTRCGYFRFAPEILLTAASVTLGRFETG